MPDPRFISLPATAILLFIILKKGADLGVRALWVVAGLLALSLLMFLLGRPLESMDSQSLDLTARVEGPDSIAMIFAICFPAFTGMTAGVGLSGDLKNPRRSIPVGTLSAALVGMVVYVLIVLKLHLSATPDELASDPLIMSQIALWGPIIPIGLAAATLSSAVGSILVAPRTLQALAIDRVFPIGNVFLGRGRGAVNEPVNATLLSAAIALGFVAAGDVNFVARIISMIFMVTYGALCGISFLEHFAGNPSYRPSFRSRWYLSLAGGVMCVMMMFQMSPVYALLSMTLMIGIYWAVRSADREARGIGAVLQGVMFQLTRRLQIMLQKNRATYHAFDWRPSVVAVSRHTLSRLAPFELLKWICHRYGFGTFIHYVEDYLSVEQVKESRRILEKLISKTEASGAGVLVDTTVAPTFSEALAQVIQLPGVSGLENNSVLFEFAADHPDELPELIKGSLLAGSLGYHTFVLRSSDRHFGYKREIHVWMTRYDDKNSNLMILLAYIIMGHPDWKNAEISIFVTFPEGKLEEQVAELKERIASGRLPISYRNVRPLPAGDDVSLEKLVGEHSGDADLVIMGYSLEALQHKKEEVLLRFPEANDILFVRAAHEIRIS
jgi:hypothetical protein